MAARHQSLAERLESLSQPILTDTENWDARRKALLAIHKEINKYPDELQPHSKEILRVLREPIKNLLSESRSKLINEVCALLEELSSTMKAHMKPLIRDVMGLLLEKLNAGNTTISGIILNTFVHFIEHTPFPAQLKDVVDIGKTTKSHPVKDHISYFLVLILEHWPMSVLEKEATLDLLQDATQYMLDANSEKARLHARTAWAKFREIWPDRARRMLECVELRTLDMLDPQREFLNGGAGGIIAEAPQAAPRVPAQRAGGQTQQGIGRTRSGTNLKRTGSGNPAPTDSTAAAMARARSQSRPAVFAGQPPRSEQMSSLAEELSHLTMPPPSGGLGGMGSPRSGPGSVEDPQPDFKDGDRVVSFPGGHRGTVRWVGRMESKKGWWAGLDLYEAKGKHDGSHEGKQYFTCRDGHGVFVRAASLVHDQAASASPTGPELLAMQLADTPSPPRGGEEVDSLAPLGSLDPDLGSRQVALELLRYHKQYMSELMEVMYQEISVVPNFEDQCKLGQSPSPEQLRNYCNMLQAVVQARDEASQLMLQRVQEVSNRKLF